MESLDALPNGRLEFLVYVVLSIAGAIGASIAAVYAVAALPTDGLALVFLWFAGVLALAAVPTVVAWLLETASTVADEIRRPVGSDTADRSRCQCSSTAADGSNGICKR